MVMDLDGLMDEIVPRNESRVSKDFGSKKASSNLDDDLFGGATKKK